MATKTVAAFAPSGDLELEEARIARRLKLAEALAMEAERSGGPQGGMVGRIYVPPSWTQHLAAAVRSPMAGLEEKAATDELKKLGEEKRTRLNQDMARMSAALTQGNMATAPGAPPVQVASVNPNPSDAPGSWLAQEPAAAPRGAPSPADLITLAQGIQTPQLQGALTTAALTKMLASGEWVRAAGYNPETGRDQVWMVNKNDPTQRIPLGGQKAVELKNWNGSIANPITGQVQGRLPVSPDAAARLTWDQYTHQNPSAYQRNSMANQNAQTGIAMGRFTDETGQRPPGGGLPLPPNAPMPNLFGPGGAPFMAPGPQQQAPAPQPQMAPRPPMAPQPRPAMAPPPAAAPAVPGQPGVPSPQQQREIATAVEKQRREAEVKRQSTMAGISGTLDMAENILKGVGPSVGGVPTNAPRPTGSWTGKAMDVTGSLFGVSPRGAAQADQLRAIAGALVARMPRMEGPQSNFDVQNYQRMAGDIGNDTLPIERRLAALNVVRELWAKYDPQGLQGGAPQSPVVPPGPQQSRPAAPGGVRFLGFEGTP